MRKLLRLLSDGDHLIIILTTSEVARARATANMMNCACVPVCMASARVQYAEQAIWDGYGFGTLMKLPNPLSSADTRQDGKHEEEIWAGTCSCTWRRAKGLERMATGSVCARSG